MAGEPGGQEFPSQPEAPKQTSTAKPEKPWLDAVRKQRERDGESPLKPFDSTEASRSFLRKFADRLFTDRPERVQVFVQDLMAGGVAKLAIQDAIQGNYPSAAVEGIVAGVLAVSLVRFISRLRNGFRY